METNYLYVKYIVCVPTGERRGWKREREGEGGGLYLAGNKAVSFFQQRLCIFLKECC